jgi:hypothetical protein
MGEWNHNSTHIINLNTVWKCGQLQAPAALSHYRMVGGWVGPRFVHCGAEKNLLSLPGNESALLGRPAHSLVTIPARKILDIRVIKSMRVGWVTNTYGC